LEAFKKKIKPPAGGLVTGKENNIMEPLTIGGLLCVIWAINEIRKGR